MHTFKLPLNSKVRDITTGFTGIIVGASVWSNRQITYMVQPKSRKDNTKLPELEVFDEAFLEIIK